MRYSTRVSHAVHILAYIALHPDRVLTSDVIADSIQTNPGCVRQIMSALRKADLLSSVKGRPRPSLARDPSAITLLDIYRAVEGNKPLLHPDTHTNPGCDGGVDIQLTVRDCFDRVQETAEQEMQNITLQKILDQYEKRHEPHHETGTPASIPTK